MKRLNEGTHFVLAADDIESARRFREALAHADSRARFEWLGTGPRAARILSGRLASGGFSVPQVVVVDLKRHPDAPAQFLIPVAPLARARDALVLAFAPTLAAADRTALLRAGADAVFARHDRLAVYREEVAHMVAYWRRHKDEIRLHA